MLRKKKQEKSACSYYHLQCYAHFANNTLYEQALYKSSDIGRTGQGTSLRILFFLKCLFDVCNPFFNTLIGKPCLVFNIKSQPDKLIASLRPGKFKSIPFG